MPVSFKYILYLLLLVIGCCPPMAGHAATGEKPILMICSYNPERIRLLPMYPTLWTNIRGWGQTGSGH